MSHLSISPSSMTFHFFQSTSRRICHQKYFICLWGIFLKPQSSKSFLDCRPLCSRIQEAWEISVNGKYLIRLRHDEVKIQFFNQVLVVLDHQPNVWSPWRRSRVEDPAAPFWSSGTFSWVEFHLKIGYFWLFLPFFVVFGKIGHFLWQPKTMPEYIRKLKVKVYLKTTDQGLSIYGLVYLLTCCLAGWNFNWK